LDLTPAERRESEHLSREIQRDDIMKRLVQVSGRVAGSGTNLHAPTAREWATSGQRIHERIVTLRYVSIAPARSASIEE
jgi:hypothetical protein